jgi:hypothetical protein
MSVLLVSGIIRSTFFTGANALSFSEIPESEIGQATALMAVSVQLSFALGVALAGGVLDLTTYVRNSPLTTTDFQLAFFLVAAVSLSAVIPMAMLKAGAGGNITGHQESAPK